MNINYIPGTVQSIFTYKSHVREIILCPFCQLRNRFKESKSLFNKYYIQNLNLNCFEMKITLFPLSKSTIKRHPLFKITCTGHLGRKPKLIRGSNYSWIERLNIVRMPILPKLSSKFNEIAINIPTGEQNQVKEVIAIGEQFSAQYKKASYMS